MPKVAEALSPPQRHALAAVLDGRVRLGVEENIICPGDQIDHTALHECFRRGYCCWNVRLPGGRAKLTDAGVEALR